MSNPYDEYVGAGLLHIDRLHNNIPGISPRTRIQLPAFPRRLMSLHRTDKITALGKMNNKIGIRLEKKRGIVPDYSNNMLDITAIDFEKGSQRCNG